MLIFCILVAVSLRLVSQFCLDVVQKSDYSLNTKLAKAAYSILNNLSFDRQLKILVALLALTILLFDGIIPHLDRSVSSLFFTETSCDIWKKLNPDAPRCGLFWLDHQQQYKLARRFLNPIPIVVAFGLFAIYMAKHWAPSKVHFAPDAKVLRIHIASFVIGPMIVVNWIVKPLWGRSRPFQTLDFGGYENYTSILRWGRECSGNCSFVSGEVASMAWLFLIVPIIPKKLRPIAVVVCVLLVATVAIGRMAAGRHFLSDAIFSIFIVFLCHRLVQCSEPLWSSIGKKFSQPTN